MDHARPSRDTATAVLLGTGAIGFFLGMVRFPAAPDALEPAQVLAGLVRYPPDSPVYLYSTRAWTVLHDALAVILAAGVPELTLGLLVSGLVGMLSLQALGVVVLALGQDATLAILAPFFITLTNAVSGGLTYPVSLMGGEPTYGTAGLSYALLAMALAGIGRVRSAAWMLGFSPAVHATIGAWSILIGVIAGLMSGRADRGSAGRWLLAGLAAALLCAALHYWWFDVPLPRMGGPAAPAWDDHRQPWPLWSPLALTTYFSAAIPVIWLRRHAAWIPADARVLLRMLAVAGCLSLAMSVSYWLTGPVSAIVASLMPSRMLNLNVMTCMALIVGLAAARRHPAFDALLATLVIVLLGLTGAIHVLNDERAHRVVPWLAMGAAAAAIVALDERHRRGAISFVAARPAAALRRAAGALVLLALTAAAVVSVIDFRRVVTRLMPDRTTDPLFAVVASRPGMLLTASNMHLIQLPVRRPVLLDGGAIDATVYVPDAVPATDRILARVYGTRFADVVASGVSALHHETGRALWEQRSAADWRQIARDFAVTDVLTHQGWRLQLPRVASNPDFILYALPRATD